MEAPVTSRNETFIHPSAVVEPTVQLGERVYVGPFCYLSGDAVIGDDTVLKSHAVITGKTTLGRANEVFPFASIGHINQDLKYKGEPSTLTIGDHNRIREYVTIQPGTAHGRMTTTVGNHCLFMAYSHVAHDCEIGDHVIMANCATLAGHVTVQDYAIIGGLSAVHQFVRIGSHAIIGGCSGVEYDVIPYGLVKGERSHLAGLNLIGLKRRGFPREEIESLQAVFEDLFQGENTLKERLSLVEEKYKGSTQVQDVIDFIKKAERALCTPK